MALFSNVCIRFQEYSKLQRELNIIDSALSQIRAEKMWSDSERTKGTATLESLKSFEEATVSYKAVGSFVFPMFSDTISSLSSHSCVLVLTQLLITIRPHVRYPTVMSKFLLTQKPSTRLWRLKGFLVSPFFFFTRLLHRFIRAPLPELKKELSEYVEERQKDSQACSVRCKMTFFFFPLVSHSLCPHSNYHFPCASNSPRSKFWRNNCSTPNTTSRSFRSHTVSVRPPR